MHQLTVFIALLCATFSHASVLNIVPESVDAAAWIIYDPQSEQVIAEHHSHVQRAPASLTKMMVAYITLKEIQAGRLKTTDVITATNIVHVVQGDESQMHLRVGQQITVDQLLTGLIVMSANDAAVTLAERIAGDIPHFVDQMNAEAKSLGMKNSHFMNPAGITMDAHYSSAADLAILADHLIKQYPNYLYYSKQLSYTWNGRIHHATNGLLKQDPTVDGLKTGYTQAAGYNLALTAQRENIDQKLSQRRLIVVVLGTKSAQKRLQIADQLLNLAYRYTQDEIILNPKQPIALFPVISGKVKSYTLYNPKPHTITASLYGSDRPINLKYFDRSTQLIKENDQFVQPLEHTRLRLNVQLTQKELIAPLKQNLNLASIQVFQNNQLIKDIPLSMHVQLEQASWFERLIEWFKYNLPFFSHEKQTKTTIYPVK